MGNGKICLLYLLGNLYIGSVQYFEIFFWCDGPIDEFHDPKEKRKKEKKANLKTFNAPTINVHKLQYITLAKMKISHIPNICLEKVMIASTNFTNPFVELVSKF